MFRIPGVDTGKVDVFPTERRDVLQQSIRNISPRSFQLSDRANKINRIPVHDRTDDEIEPRGAERLAFERPITDFASLVASSDGAAEQISRHATIAEQAAELIRWAESPSGPGLAALEQRLRGIVDSPSTHETRRSSR